VSAAEARTWVTEIWSPVPGDGAIRLHSSMSEPGPLPEPEPDLIPAMPESDRVFSDPYIEIDDSYAKYLDRASLEPEPEPEAEL
jgi:hypothetical protein